MKEGRAAMERYLRDVYDGVNGEQASKRTVSACKRRSSRLVWCHVVWTFEETATEPETWIDTWVVAKRRVGQSCITVWTTLFEEPRCV